MSESTILEDADPQELIKLVSGKWKLLILWHLKQRPYWFNKLKKTIGPISPSVLAKQLAQLQDAGLIERKVFPESRLSLS